MQVFFLYDHRLLCDQNISDSEKESLKKGWKNKAILILRGNCTFVEKTKNAQALGAKLAIIYDS